MTNVSPFAFTHRQVNRCTGVAPAVLVRDEPVGSRSRVYKTESTFGVEIMTARALTPAEYQAAMAEDWITTNGTFCVSEDTTKVQKVLTKFRQFHDIGCADGSVLRRFTQKADIYEVICEEF